LRKGILSFLAIALPLAATAAAQSNSQEKSNTAKPFSISAKVSEDGKLLIGKNGESWLVNNPMTLAAHVGQTIKAKVQLASANREVRVLSVKGLAPKATYTPHPGDSAFRR
jgi:hypothetical protein